MLLYFRALTCLDNCIEAHIYTSHYICARREEGRNLYPIENMSFWGERVQVWLNKKVNNKLRGGLCTPGNVEMHSF